MENHEWMMEYTRQTEWIDGRGKFLWLAFYFGGLGGGLYLVSLYFNSLWGMLVGWFIVVGLKGTTHLLYLGKPWRFWRIMFNPRTSWLSRGFYSVMLFGGFGFLQLIVSFWLPGSALEVVLKVLAGIAAFIVATYTGIILKNVKGVQYWNSPLLPVLFVLCGILGGFGISVVIALLGGDVDLVAAENGSRLFLLLNVLVIVIYLWRAAQRGETGRQSVLEQMRGSMAGVFWFGVITAGIVVPVITAVLSTFIGEASSGVLIFGVACEIAGGLSLRYCVLKAGAYNPLVKDEQINRNREAVLSR